MNNSVFGKTMENVRNRSHITLHNTSNKKGLSKVLDRVDVTNITFISDHLVAIERSKKSVCANKPITVGFAILDLAKILIYDFHYNYIVKKYGSNCKLLYTDTDSVIYLIKTEDFYYDMKSNSDIFDLSNYNKSHILYSEKNKKVIGKMKDECAKGIIIEWISLKPKLYNYTLLLNNDKEENTKAKGTRKYFIDKILRAISFKNSLNDKKFFSGHVNKMKSLNHKITNIRQKRDKILSPFDDKRYINDDGISSLPYGHHSLLN